MIENDSANSPNVAGKFCCNYCYYFTSKKSDYKKHLVTLKHQKAVNDSKMVANDSAKSQKVANIYYCSCGKAYKYDSGYYRHKKSCNFEKLSTDEKQMENSVSDKDLIMMLVKQNTVLMELVKNGTNNTTNNTNTNIINFYLIQCRC